MLPIRVDIQHFRAIRNCALDLGDYTALVGPNGVGKSTVLQALRFFFDPASTVGENDFQPKCTEPVSVTVTLAELTAEEISAYEPSLSDSKNLIVTKKAAWDGMPSYVVRAKKHLAFDSIRQSADSKSEFLSAFRTFADENPKKYGLQKQRSSELCEAELQRWERENPKECVDGEVRFSFSGSAKGQLIPSTHLVYVPAVSEASETVTGARSPLSQMIDALVYPRLEEKPEFVALKELVQREYREMFPLDGATELQEISAQLTKALSAFVQNASVNLGWAEGEPSLELPSVHPTIVEDGVSTDVDRKGHGLQRAMIIAMLQAEDDYRRSLEERTAGATTHVLFMIEEPELYQHPPMARHFRRVLSDLATRPSGPSRLRVLLTTHSPDFVSLEAIDTIRILRMEPKTKGVPKRRITSVDLAKIAEKFASVADKPMNEQALQKRLHIADPVMREAFFANAVVLAEGAGDLGLICGECAVANVDLEGKGIVVISCDGKAKMALPVCVLELLGIRYYAVFDGDTAAQIEENKTLLRALKADKKDIPASGTPATAVRKNYAVLNPKVEELIRNDFGKKLYEDCAKETASEFGVEPADIMKNPVTAQYAIAAMREKGAKSKTLDDVISHIGALA
jgi:predicted ATP-dependent endonuclease of OLD family